MNIFLKKLDFWKDPQEVFENLFQKKNNVFWLDSSRAEQGMARFSYMGEATSAYSYSLKDKISVFAYLEKQIKKHKIKENLPFDFVGGFVGYFGYELQALTGYSTKLHSVYPDSLWMLVTQFFVFDYKEKSIYLVCLSNNKKSAKRWIADSENKIKVQKKIKKIAKTIDAITFSLDRSHKQYLLDIQKCKEYLKNGESYQICLTNQFRTKAEVDDFSLYKTLRTLNPAPYGAFIKHNDLAILSSSPERFLYIDSKKNVETKPIKGTSKRSNNKKEDAKLAQELLHSEKDRAENLMITDLLRNDLGKVCKIGSIHVPKLISLESYQTVHQLVSTVTGTLRKDVSIIDCILACFPGGSMTGAPKKRTTEIIATLEKKPRGIYSGALGFLSFTGAVNLSIVIRTIVKQKNTISIGAGGAVLMQSDAEKEYQEMLLKAKVLLDAITQAAHAKRYIIKT
ncbi:MAG TPA: aminodeoxychorismate synthase component I [Patescibacteria group bacterium]